MRVAIKIQTNNGQFWKILLSFVVFVNCKLEKTMFGILRALEYNSEIHVSIGFNNRQEMARAATGSLNSCSQLARDRQQASKAVVTV